MMRDFLERLRTALRPPRPVGTWNAARIGNDWFRNHFNYAADTIIAHAGRHLNFRNASLLDFGCGDGITDLGLALKTPCRSVLGVDLHDSFATLGELARTEIALDELPPNLRFRRIDGKTIPLASRSLDAIVSWSVFEHVEMRDLRDIAREFRRILRPGGIVFLQICPLYHSPFGSHLDRMLPEPWIHLLRTPLDIHRLLMSADMKSIPDDQRDLPCTTLAEDNYKAFLFREFQRLNRATASDILTSFTDAGFGMLEDIRHRVEFEPPSPLAALYPLDDLMTHEIISIFRRR